MRKILLFSAAISALALGGCAGTLQKIQQFSTNYQAAVVSINQDIAATAPLVAKSCGDLQTAAMLLAPFIPQNAKAPQYFAAANGALQAYCQVVPTDIYTTGVAVAAAVKAAQEGYHQVSGK